MGGEVEVARIESSLVTVGMMEHGALEVIDEHDGRDPAEKLEGVLVGAQEMLGGLAESEFDINHAAVGQHHDEKGKPPGGGADRHGSRVAPIDLGAFARREGEGQESGVAHGADPAHILLENAEAACVASLLAQALQDLGGAVGMGFEPAQDERLVRVEFARARTLEPALRVALEARPLGHGLSAQMQLACDLGKREPSFAVILPDLAVEIVGDHACGPPLAASIWRRMEPIASGSPERRPSWEDAGRETGAGHPEPPS